jgi:hypothetical protein
VNYLNGRLSYAVSWDLRKEEMQRRGEKGVFPEHMIAASTEGESRTNRVETEEILWKRNQVEARKATWELEKTMLQSLERDFDGPW